MTRLALVVGLLGAVRAWACSGLTCESIAVPVPAAGSIIPANAPAVGIQRTIFSDTLIDGGIEYLAVSTESLQLRGPDGGLVSGPSVESALGAFVETSLVAGNWTISLDSEPCSPDAGFVVGPAAPLPTVAANISVPTSYWTPAFEGMTSCYGPYPAQQVTWLRIEASTEMVPWLPLARWELEVDGLNISTSRFGRVTATPYDAVPMVPFWTFNAFPVQCGDTPDGGNPRVLQPGIHAVRVLARILGVSTPIASNTLQVEVICTPPPFDGGTAVPDAGTPDAGTPDAGTPDAGTPDAGTPVSVDAGSGSDAGASPPPPPPSGCSSVGLQFVTLAALLLRRRRLSSGCSFRRYERLRALE